MVVAGVCRITGSYNRLSLFSQGARGVMARIASSDPRNPYQPTFPYRTEIFIILGREDLCFQLNLRIKNPHSKNICPIFSPGCMALSTAQDSHISQTDMALQPHILKPMQSIRSNSDESIAYLGRSLCRTRRPRKSPVGTKAKDYQTPLPRMLYSSISKGL